MEQYTLFDVMGPVMIGPSSSHTAGACRIARLARKFLGSHFDRADFYLYGSFAETYLGHGTDRALLAGILGMDVDDQRLPASLEIADQKGIAYQFIPQPLEEGMHPNTVRIVLHYPDGQTHSLTGSSVGGGNIVLTSIDGLAVEYTNDYPMIILRYKEQKGVIAFVSSLLSENGYNIEMMKTMKNGKEVSLFIELGEELDKEIGRKILEDPRFLSARYLSSGY